MPANLVLGPSPPQSDFPIITQSICSSSKFDRHRRQAAAAHHATAYATMAFTSENTRLSDVRTSNEIIVLNDRQCRAWTLKPGEPRCLNNKVVNSHKPQVEKTHAERIADELCGTHKKNISKFAEKVTRDLANIASASNPRSSPAAGLATSFHTSASGSTPFPPNPPDSDTTGQTFRTNNHRSWISPHADSNTQTPHHHTTRANRFATSGDGINYGQSNFGSFDASEASLGGRGPRIMQETGKRNLSGLIKDCRMVIDMLSSDRFPPTRTVFTREERSKQDDVNWLDQELGSLLSLFDMSIAEEEAETF